MMDLICFQSSSASITDFFSDAPYYMHIYIISGKIYKFISLINHLRFFTAPQVEINLIVSCHKSIWRWGVCMYYIKKNVQFYFKGRLP